MAIIASAKSGTVSTPAPAGAHVARCIRVIYLGLQFSDGQYGPKVAPKVMITWELPNELHVFREERGPEPFTVSRDYTLSLSEKSNLRADLQSWRGRPFTPEELDAFDVSKLANATCTLNVIHEKAKNGNTYANVASIAPMMKGIVCPPAIQEVLIYEVANKRDAVFAKLPEWIQNKIAACEDWKAQAPRSDFENDEADFKAAMEATGKTTAEDEDATGIPF